MIYLTGDTHGKIDIKKIFDWQEGQNLTKEDYLIILGDFGLIFYGKDHELYEREQKLIKKLNDCPWTTLFVDGNHENFRMLNEFPEETWNGGKIKKIADSILWLKRGQVFNIDGKKFFTLGGGTSLDKGKRLFLVTWWPEENITYGEINESIKNLSNNNYQVDYVLTHCAPESFKEDLFKVLKLQSFGTCSNEKALENIKNRINFKKWFFGHYHFDLIQKDYVALYDRIINLEDKLIQNG